jgi:hypothetical protein
MIRKFLLGASLSGLLLAGAPAILHGGQNPPRPQPGQPGQQEPGQQPGQQPPQQQPPQQDAKSVTGKVTDIGDQGHSFTVDAANGQSMKFMVDKNTQVKGQVKVGSTVAVDYTSMGGGQFLCLRVAAQQS